MLFYLDNWLSADPQAPARARANPQKPRGLNENYARELLELHTLGVDGGYTQQDIVEVARAFTGWTLRAPRRDRRFVFDRRLHAPGRKVVLGTGIEAGGMRDGEAVLTMLARHPRLPGSSRRSFARRFVSDEPPTVLVERLAKAFVASHGHMRVVLGTLVDSPEFWSRRAYRAKVKTPLELVTSTARALDLHVEGPLAQPLAQWTARIGQPLYLCQPPTGYSDLAASWVNTGALREPPQFLAGAGRRPDAVAGQAAALPSLLGVSATSTPSLVLERTVEQFLGSQASQQTQDTLRTRRSNDRGHVAGPRSTESPSRAWMPQELVAGLVLGAPEFQRR